jgi:hypothetical protein
LKDSLLSIKTELSATSFDSAEAGFSDLQFMKNNEATITDRNIFLFISLNIY